MRLLILISFGFILILGCGQKKKTATGWNYDEAQSDGYYEVKIPHKKNMKEEEPRKIILEPDKRQHFINFGMFDTETNWKIYDWLSYHGSDSQLPKPFIDTSFKANQESVVNISSLNKGKYMVNFTSNIDSGEYKGKFIATGISSHFELTIQ